MTDRLVVTCAACGQANRVAADRLGQGPRCGTCGEPLADGRVRAVDAATHDRMVARDGLPVLVDYWASWCGPCRMMAPEFEKAAALLAPGVRLVKLDTEAHPAVAQRAGIRGIPALILYAGGREVARAAGARPAAAIAEFVRANLPAAAGV